MTQSSAGLGYIAIFCGFHIASYDPASRIALGQSVTKGLIEAGRCFARVTSVAYDSQSIMGNWSTLSPDVGLGTRLFNRRDKAKGG